MHTRRPTRRQVLAGLALTTGAALTRKLRAFSLTDAQIAGDPMRPQYHLLPTHGWMNDPCGPIYWKGRYHMFLQYNSEPVSAVKLWAHATSSDMIHWHREPIALAPTSGGPDADGCWTGTAAVLDGKPTFLYTGVANSTPDRATLVDANPPLRESVCMAVAEDDALLHWRKQPQPVIPAPPARMKVVGFRDPSPWRQGNDWYLIVASGERGAGGRVLLYRSADFRHWEYLHPMAQGKPNGKQGTDPVDSGEMWECPDFSRSTANTSSSTPRSAAPFGRSARSIRRPCSFTRKTKGCSMKAPTTRPNRSSMRRATASSGGGSPTRARKPSTRCRLVRHDVPAAPPLHRQQPSRHGARSEAASLRTTPLASHRPDGGQRCLPSPRQEIRLTLTVQVPEAGPAGESFTTIRGPCMLLHAEGVRLHPAPRSGRQRDHRHRQRSPRSPHLSSTTPWPKSSSTTARSSPTATTSAIQRSPPSPSLSPEWQLTRQQAWSLKSIW